MMRRNLVVLVALLAAMTVGRVLTDHVPVGTEAVKPFVRTADVGQRLQLRYADIEVTDVRAAAFLDQAGSAVSPAGRFLVVDATVRARNKPQMLSYVALLGGDDRRYAATTRGGCTGEAYTAPTGLDYHVMYCLDVPRTALAGSTLEVSLGDPGEGGGQRRDDAAHIDLGIGRAKSSRIWATTTGYRGFGGGLDRPDRTALTLRQGS